jgi:hypothetical protein
MERHPALVEEMTGSAAGSLASLAEVFGISGICNVLGAIRFARHLHLGSDDNVVTIATDGFDRYPSVLADLAGRCGPIDRAKLCRWFEAIYRGGDAGDILDIRGREEKERLFAYKEQVWPGFGYSRSYLAQMQAQGFWDAQFEAIEEIDRDLLKSRKL